MMGDFDGLYTFEGIIFVAVFGALLACVVVYCCKEYCLWRYFHNQLDTVHGPQYPGIPNRVVEVEVDVQG